MDENKIMNLAKEYEDEGDFEKAIKMLEDAFDEKLGSFHIRADMGRVYNKMRKYWDALSCFEIVLTMDDNNSDYLFGKGIALIGLNKFDLALEVFEELISIDETNANAWYYKTLVSKSLGDFAANHYFNNFLKYDNDDFRLFRSFYQFGIYFDEIENKYRKFPPLTVMSEFKKQLKDLNLDDDKYTEIIRLCPLNILFDEMPKYNQDKFEDDTENIIRQEFKKQGFSDDDIDGLFELESVENLKEEVISLSEENPFTKKHVSNFIPLKTASRYNIIRPNLLKKNEDLILYNRGNYYLDTNEIEKAIECYDEGLNINPDNKLLKFVKCCAEYKLNGGY